MVDSKLLVEFAKHPQLAFQKLSYVLDFLESSDETEVSCATDLLENCGAPGLAEIAYLCEQLKSKQPPRIYWCSTLLGRLGAAWGNTEERRRVQMELCQVIGDESLELSARERAAWAIAEIGTVDSGCRALLKTRVGMAPPRLKRLLETALAT